MKKFTSTIHDANLHIARVSAKHSLISVGPIRTCGGCGGDASVLINGIYPRCSSCANQVINIWSQMRANKNGEDS